MADRIQVRRGTASAWTSANPVLTAGEIGFVTDTGNIKIGDGSTAWNSLAYQFATIGGSETLTNKTLTTPVISTISNTGTLTLPTATDTLVGRATTDTLTNKTMSGSSNTLSNIGNSSLVNSSITINGTAVSLGGSITVSGGSSETFHPFAMIG